MKRNSSFAGYNIVPFVILFVLVLMPCSLVSGWTLRPWEPSSRSPANGATNVLTIPTFNWSGEFGASSYVVCVTEDPNLTAGYIPCIGSAEGTSYTVPESMRFKPCDEVLLVHEQYI